MAEDLSHARDDMVFAWEAPDDGVYRIEVRGALAPRIGIGAPECGGELEMCVEDVQSSRYIDDEGHIALLRDFEAGEQVHIVVERDWEEGEFDLSITPSDGTPPGSGDTAGDSCDYQRDGTCDEPQGTGLCPAGTDSEDCTCPYTNDDECDEPQGTGLCEPGTDSADC